jgi:hypothetical protein
LYIFFYTCFYFLGSKIFEVAQFSFDLLRQTEKSEQQAVAFLSKGIGKWLNTDVVYIDCQTHQVFHA